MAASPLLTHAAPDAIVAYRAGRPVAARRFLADATALAALLPPGRHLLNVCLDRYRFTVGLAACLMTQRVSLLPSTHTPEVVRRLLDFAPDALCLTDEQDCTIALPQFLYPPALEGSPVAWKVPQIPESQLAAIVFTSGSTGTPLPYPKTWGRLARCVRDGAPRLGLLDGRRHTLIGTVPAQHMYGFESTVLLALLSGNALSAERPFYPADISAAIAAVPEPRALITTPVHLRALLADEVVLPPVELIVSATAPLDLALAHAAEAAFRAPLLEIYGSTETGQIATRRTAQSLDWHLWPGVWMTAQDQEVFAQGGHVEQRSVMCDVIEILDDTHFLLHGRTADLVNVAGKRSSFAHLNKQLVSIPGVVDGAFFLRDGDVAGHTGVARLAAVVVAPTLDAARLTDELRRRIDAVFLPRPLLLVTGLPRNATGKLPHAALQAFAARELDAQGRTPAITLRIAMDHPAYAGHFPGFPILPGAVLLDEVLRELARHRALDLTQWQVSSVKFLERVSPGDPLQMEHTAPSVAVIRFIVRCAAKTVATGALARQVRTGELHGF